MAIYAFVRRLSWIASFLAMTEQGRNDAVGAQPLRHCEARSAVAIYAFVRGLSWIASFLAMTEQGRNEAVGAQ